MIFRNKRKPRERYYLLPGQGGINYVRKQRVLLGWAIAFSLVLGIILTGLMLWQAKPHL